MRKKAKWTILLTYLINFVLVLGLAGNASAVVIDWDDGAHPDESWNAPNNWDGNNIPTNIDDANLNMPDTNCLIDSSVNAQCDNLVVGDTNGPCWLDMTGGTLTVDLKLIIGDEGNSTTDGIFTMSGGTVFVGTDLAIGEGGTTLDVALAKGTLRMTGGLVSVGTVKNDKLEMGNNPTGDGTIYMSGGTINCVDDIELATTGIGTIYMTGGDFNTVDKLRLGDEGGTATIHISDGNLTCNELTMNNNSSTPTIYLIEDGNITCSTISMLSDNAKIDINEGVLVVQTDGEENEIKGYVRDEKIIGYHGGGIVDVTSTGGGSPDILVTARLADPNLAWYPTPRKYDKVRWTPAGPTLTWRPGRYVADSNGHDVYFGTDKDDVNDANRADPCGVLESEGQDPCSYGPLGPLVLDQTYYWRIDEVNDACDPCSWKGDIWEFDMNEYVDVEDFESYANQTALEAVWTLTGSAISLEPNIVHSGDSSMKYEYTNSSSPYYTEADANTTTGPNLPVIIRDWTKADIKALTLYFHGDVNNPAEEMYVALRDANNDLAIVYYEDLNDLNEPEWHEWNIKMSDFDTNDFDSNDVNKVYIGFGKRESPAADGNGIVYFDDIRLYPRRCVPADGPDGDIAALGDEDELSKNRDCCVDFYDVNEIAGDWLKKDYKGVGRDADVNGGTWTTEGKYDNAVELDGDNDWVDLDNSGFTDFHNKTIAFWVKVRDYPPAEERHMFFFSNEDFIKEGETPYRIYIMTYTQGVVRARFIDEYSGEAFAGQGTWRHLAFTLEDTVDGKCTGKFYLDGAKYGDEMSGKPRHSGGASGVNIGSFDDGDGSFVDAVFDEFRVYDYALSKDEVKYLAGKAGTAPDDNLMLYRYDFNEADPNTVAHNSSTYEFYHPLLSTAELHKGEAEGERIINFRDYVILADDWLEEKLWP